MSDDSPHEQKGLFKEAWYHDFAPPIHSLDRHADFAPPINPLQLDKGFFGAAPTTPVFQPLQRFNTNAVSVAASATVFVTWVPFAGDTLLDLTNPQSGVLLQGGQYSFSVTTHVFPSPAALRTGYYSMGFDLTGVMDSGFAAPKNASDNRIWPGLSNDSYISLAGTWRVEAGAILTMSIQSNLNATVFMEYVANLQKL